MHPGPSKRDQVPSLRRHSPRIYAGIHSKSESAVQRVVSDDMSSSKLASMVAYMAWSDSGRSFSSTRTHAPAIWKHDGGRGLGGTGSAVGSRDLRDRTVWEGVQS